MDVLDQDAPALSPNDTESLVKPVVNMFSAALMLGSVALQAVLGRVGAKRQPLVLRRPVDSFINTETPIALEQLLCNIGADGCNARAATPGVVIASPSTWDPDCTYGARAPPAARLTCCHILLHLDARWRPGLQGRRRQVRRPVRRRPAAPHPRVHRRPGPAADRLEPLWLPGRRAGPRRAQVSARHRRLHRVLG